VVRRGGILDNIGQGRESKCMCGFMQINSYSTAPEVGLSTVGLESRAKPGVFVLHGCPTDTTAFDVCVSHVPSPNHANPILDPCS
jgi:hypothetical protein